MLLDKENPKPLLMSLCSLTIHGLDVSFGAFREKIVCLMFCKPKLQYKHVSSRTQR